MRRAAFALALFAIVLACTPTRFRVAPYDVDAVRAQELAERAETICRERRGDRPPPEHRFTSDGCSMWPDASWKECCIEHDIAYWCGGSAADRRRADDALAACVEQRASRELGSVMRVGVIVGGVPWQPMPWRWGYGFGGIRGYEE